MLPETSPYEDRRVNLGFTQDSGNLSENPSCPPGAREHFRALAASEKHENFSAGIHEPLCVAMPGTTELSLAPSDSESLPGQPS